LPSCHPTYRSFFISCKFAIIIIFKGVQGEEGILETFNDSPVLETLVGGHGGN